MPVEWYCRLMGSEMGPFRASQLVEMARTHQLTSQDLVKKGADGRWVEAHRVRGLFAEAPTSSIIMASLPPELMEASQRQQEQTKKAPKPKPRPESWFYISGNGKTGPLSFAELIDHGQKGLLKPADRVWSSNTPKWRLAKKIEGLSFD